MISRLISRFCFHLSEPPRLAIDGQVYQGVVAAPVEAEVGQSISIRRFTILSNGPFGLSRRDVHSGGRAFVAIGAFDDGVFTTHGSGIMIGPGIAVTAKHVIDEVLEQGGAGGLFAISCGTDRNIEIWGLLSYVRKAEFDLAIVTAQPQSEVSPFREMILPTITARVPDVGERVTAVGFRNTTLENTSSSSMIMLWSSGLVSANYPIGRDSVMLPGPSFEMDLPIVGGMSGGPVFDCHGNLIAVISTSLSSAEMKPSFAFLAWPLAALEIQPTWPRNMYPDVRAIKDLAPMVEVVNGQNVRKWADGDLEKFELSL